MLVHKPQSNIFEKTNNRLNHDTVKHSFHRIKKNTSVKNALDL